MGFKSLITLLVGADTTKMNTNLKKGEKQLDRFGKSAKGLGGVIRGLGGAFALLAIGRDVTQRIIAFDDAMVGLSAILRTSRKDIENLERQAIKLGGATLYTANQVGILQTELARYGFDIGEIEDSTRAILDFAAAAKIGTTEASQLAAGTLRAFNMEASEMTRVVDVLTNGLTKSALDFESLSQAMVYAAPLADAVNISLEETTAVMGILADANIKGSIAGTSMRRILTELGKDGLTLADIFEADAKSIDKFTDRLKHAKDQTGQYALSSFLVLQDNYDQIRETTKAMGELGSANAVAAQQFTSIKSKLTLLNSAWEGLILTVDNGNGIASRAMKHWIENVTELLQLMSGNEPETFQKKLEELGYESDTTKKDKEPAGVVSTLFNTVLAYQKAHALSFFDWLFPAEDLERIRNQAAIIAAIQKDLADNFIGPMPFNQEAHDAWVKATQGERDDIKAFQDEQLKLSKKYQDQVEKIYGYQVDTVVELDKITGLYREIEAVTKRVNAIKPAQSMGIGIATGEDGEARTDIVTTPTGTDVVDQEWLARIMETWEAEDALINKNDELAQSYADTTMSIGRSLAQGAENWQAYGDNLGQVVIEMAGQYALAASTAAVAAAVKEGASYSLFAIPAFVGLALGMVKTAMSGAKSTASTAFADGGIVSGPLGGYQLLGEYSGASNNPEVVAPLDKLRGMISDLGTGGDVNVTGEFKLKNRELVAAINRETNRANRYAG